MRQSLSGGLTGGDEVLQILAFLGGQGGLEALGVRPSFRKP